MNDPGHLLEADLRATSQLPELRRAVRALLTERSIAPERIDDIVLVVSELATNALEAMTTDETGSVSVRVSGLTIEIECSNPIRPGLGRPSAFDTDDPTRQRLSRAMPGPDFDRGRGLALAVALASEVTTQVRDGRVAIHACFAG